MELLAFLLLSLLLFCVHDNFGNAQVLTTNSTVQQSCVRPTSNLPFNCGGVQDIICTAWETVSEPERLQKYRTFESYKVRCISYADQFPPSLDVVLSVHRDPNAQDPSEEHHNEEIVVKTFSKFPPTNLPEMYFSARFNFPEIRGCGKVCIKVQVKDKRTQKLVSCQYGCFYSKD